MRPRNPIRVPILTYHQVGHFPAAEVRRQRGNYVSAQRFAEQVRVLHRLGFQGVTLAQVGRWLAGEGTLPPRPVAFTFDDAYRNVFEHAYPILAEHGWVATTFVVTGELGGSNRWDLPKGIPAAPLMSLPQLQKLAASGWEIGAHSRSHPHLPELSGPQREEEIAGSRADLELLLEQPVTSWCYPYGALDAAIVQAVHAAGYRAAVTLRPGSVRPASAPLLLPRLHVGYRVDWRRFLLRVLLAGLF